jgi:TonB family protein
MTRTITIIVLLSLCPAAVHATTESRLKALMLVAPRPVYPQEAIIRRFQGCGKYQIDMNKKTGAPVKVHALQSAGHPILDNAAVSAFIWWRAKPGTIERIVIPVCFSFRSGKPTVTFGSDTPNQSVQPTAGRRGPET